MSNWEDEYDENGVAIPSHGLKPAPAKWKLPCSSRQRDIVGLGVRDGEWFRTPRGGRADNSRDGFEFRRHNDGGTGRPPPRSSEGGGRWSAESAPRVILTVENASVGRIIGKFVIR